MSAGGRPSRGLLVDYGGVLTTDVFEAFRAFCRLEGLEPDALVRNFEGSAECRQLVWDLETGALGEEAFEPAFAAILGVQAPGLLRRLFADARLNEEMCACVLRARRAGVPTGLISNSWGTGGYDRPRLAELFDDIVISGEVGLRKPAAEIYALGAERIGVEPSACVFVDDIASNLAPAEELGMATVHHVETARTVAELQRLLGFSLA
jgi:epoxide hydrolase-like predicted phosphatase